MLNAFIAVRNPPTHFLLVLIDWSILQKNPTATYTFDSERGAPESEICRIDGPKSSECIMVGVSLHLIHPPRELTRALCAASNGVDQVVYGDAGNIYARVCLREEN